MKDSFRIIQGAHLTEKADHLKENYGEVVFKVDLRANKVDIKNAVEKNFNVKVGRVRTARVRGKERRVGRHLGRTSDWKKAIITLTEGKIDFLGEL